MPVTATCACKSCTVTAEGDPAANVYCHCTSCCVANGAPFAAIGLFPQDNVKIEGPIKEVKITQRPDGAVRLVCENCGTRVSSRPSGGAPLRSVYPITTPDNGASWFKPSMHIFCDDHAPYLDPKLINDGLPKYKGLPATWGGSDEQL